MPSYGYGASSSQGGGPAGYQASRRSYGYRPGWQPVNPFKGYSGNETSQDYYNNNPQAVIGQWMAANPYGQVPPALRAQMERWLGEQQGAYQGALGMRPDLNFMDWLGERSFTDDYEATNPYAQNLRANFRTRYLRR